MYLLFVYNANSDRLSAAIDMVHKILSPSTYACDLCAITYGNFKIKKEWSDFITALPIKSVFLHKDEFQKKYPASNITLPAVFAMENEQLELVISAEQMSHMQLPDLMESIRKIAQEKEILSK